MQLTVQEVETEMQRLVDQGKAEFRKAGKGGPGETGVSIQICVPAGTPILRTDRPRGDENLVAKGEL